MGRPSVGGLEFCVMWFFIMAFCAAWWIFLIPMVSKMLPFFK